MACTQKRVLDIADALPSSRRTSSVKRLKLISPRNKLSTLQSNEPCSLLTLGQGDVGQLGHGPNIMRRKKPKLCDGLNDVVSVAAGGMHSVVLYSNGQVATFGCNDDGALGRVTEDEDECFTPKVITFPDAVKVVSVSAGDSHSVALTQGGKVYFWGSFRDSNGVIGLLTDGVRRLPVAAPICKKIVKIASGCDHVALLSEEGGVYTVGCGEQGQLGRLGPRSASRNTRRGLENCLIPDVIYYKRKFLKCVDIWAGAYATIMKTVEKEIFVCGLNNYGQLGVPCDSMGEGNAIYIPTILKTANFNGDWAEFAIAEHHTLSRSGTGQVFSFGRSTYGRLGLGNEAPEQHTSDPTLVTNSISGKVCTKVDVGPAVSFAVVAGNLYAWGMITNEQLGVDAKDSNGEEIDVFVPTLVTGRSLDKGTVVSVSIGGQHTAILVNSAASTQPL